MKDKQQRRHRPYGRPKGYNRTEIPWELVDRLLVYGERVRNEGGDIIHRYPSYQDVADRYRCSKSLVALYGRSHNCIARRKQAHAEGEENPIERTSTTSMPVSEHDVTPSLVLARTGPKLSTEDNLAIVDTCLREFARALDEGRFRCDSPGDLKLLLQLREKLDEDHTRSTAQPEITLEQIQARHRELMQQMDNFDPWLTGEADPRTDDQSS